MRFSLFNLLLMMLPLALVFACVGHGIRSGLNLLTVVATVLGLAAAYGVLADGWRGIWRAVGTGIGAIGLICITLIICVVAGAFLLLAASAFGSLFR